MANAILTFPIFLCHYFYYILILLFIKFCLRHNNIPKNSAYNYLISSSEISNILYRTLLLKFDGFYNGFIEVNWPMYFDSLLVRKLEKSKLVAFFCPIILVCLYEITIFIHFRSFVMEFFLRSTELGSDTL